MPAQNFTNPLCMVSQLRLASPSFIPFANFSATSTHGNVSAKVPKDSKIPFMALVRVVNNPLQSMPVNALPSPVAIAVPKAAKSNSSTNAFAPQMIALMAFANASPTSSHIFVSLNTELRKSAMPFPTVRRVL